MRNIAKFTLSRLHIVTPHSPKEHCSKPSYECLSLILVVLWHICWCITAAWFAWLKCFGEHDNALEQQHKEEATDVFHNSINAPLFHIACKIFQHSHVTPPKTCQIAGLCQLYMLVQCLVVVSFGYPLKGVVVLLGLS